MRGGKALLLLLVALGAAGAWNYHRNVAEEQAELRPYRGYSGADLDALEEAHAAEVERLAAAYRRAKQQSVEIRDRGLVAEKVEQFERVQRVSRRKRELGRQLSMREADLREIEQERAKREAEKDRLRLFLTRLLSVSGDGGERFTPPFAIR